MPHWYYFWKLFPLGEHCCSSKHYCWLEENRVNSHDNDFLPYENIRINGQFFSELRVQSTQFITVSCLTLFGFGESKESSLWSLEPVFVLDSLDLGRGLGLTKAFWTPPLLDVSPALHGVGNTFFKSISQARWEDLLLDRGGGKNTHKYTWEWEMM